MIPAQSSVLGVSIDSLSMAEVVDCCARAIEERGSLVLGMVNAAKLIAMHDNKALRQAIESCDLILADGMSVVWASRLQGAGLAERVAGIDLFFAILKMASEKSRSIYLLGARDDVLFDVIKEISVRFPGVRIAGSHNGYFDEREERRIVDDIKASGADVLFVGISPPKKELFLARWGRETGVPVCHGVGGSFDVLAGRVSRASVRWQRLGLEWLHRVFQEPRRMWKRYLTTNSRFLYLLVREMLGLGCSRN